MSNVEVLEKAIMPGIEYFLIKSQFRWTGHLIRMSDDRIPKQLLFGQLAQESVLSQSQNCVSKTY